MQLQRLGPYEIGEPLGKGGMGSVYAATDTATGQRVAVKALSPTLATAEGFRERFEAEIESLKTLRHAGIVRLYGYGEQDGVLFYSMELVEGTSLEEELKAGRRFNWREVTNIAIQTALALKHAHDHGVIHRDIKPANILLTRDDRVKLADFGIARLFGSTQLTTAGGVLGTADYMSPEQADGRPVTARCDQYSLGGVMYALLAGRPPFRAKNLPQMLQMQRFADPERVRRYAADTPEQLEHVVMQLLAKDPAARFPNTQVLARHLQAMYRALTRPTTDVFSLANDESASPDLDSTDESLLTARTQADPSLMESGDANASDPRLTGSSLPHSGNAAHEAATLVATGDVGESVKSAVGPRSPSQPPVATESAASELRTVHFRTVEEDEALTQFEGRSRLVVFLQLVALFAVVGGAATFLAYAMRPPSADELYRSIVAVAESPDGESLISIEEKLAEFRDRFPDDPRVERVREFEDRLALEQAARRIQIAQRAGTAGRGELLPAERLYLRAVATAADSPARAIGLFESIVALYGDSLDDDRSNAQKSPERERELLCVQLAQDRAATLRNVLEPQIDEQLASLRERLAAAEAISATDPARAATMFRAIVTLHQDDTWAVDFVREAQKRLDQIQSDSRE